MHYCNNLTARFHLREISRISGLPAETTARELRSLEHERVLLSRLEGRNKYFTLNLNLYRTKMYIIEAEINRTLEFLAKYPLFNTFIKSMPLFNGAVTLFGSFARAEPTKTSDVDLLVIADNDISLPLELLPKSPHKITISQSDFLKAIDNPEPLIREIAHNHIILYNHSYFVEAMWRYYGKKT